MAARRLGQIMVDLGYISEDQLWDILEEQKQSPGEVIGQVAIRMGLVTDEQVTQALAEQWGMPVVELSETNIPPKVLELVPETMASIYKIMPVSLKDGVLTVAMADPQNVAALDDLRNFLGYDVRGAVSNLKDVEAAIERHYSEHQDSIEDVIGAIEDELGEETGKNVYNITDTDELVDAAPIRKLLNMVMLLAIKDKASDIHMEPFEDEFKIRVRADGVLYEMVPPPRHLANAIVSRIKIMADLDIAERRLPQDGRIELNVGGNPVDLRVSVLPTLFGEAVVMRVLDRTVVQLDLNKIGMDPNTLTRFREMIHRPNGIVLVTGPTGSGKTTTLYSALNELNVIEEKIITTEDPIEYDIDGLIQVPVNPDIQVTFASVLRAILRHDPDQILIGEIRDYETAEIAVQSALTGHLVFSTLHTNDAPSAITRLRDMGVPTFLITATVEAIQAQRLVRTICKECRTEFEPSDELLMELQLPIEQARQYSFYYGKGCATCNNSGYKGRTGLYELMDVTDEIRDLITEDASVDDIRNVARSQGMTTLREAGLKLIFDGVTTIDEVVRETVMEDIE
ncbi:MULTISPECIES: GspE/PulE family protein [Gimesia]|jgi:type IV pilus assembly protein PilB|uniref:Type II/IV secretion system protein n=2 Tax=Gimesia TaxID=1649453 RepID=A0A517WKT5_9PLAN|nr:MULTISPECIES: ATPase, T2SS/T4P/T4SS family [Gimesia]MBN69205.1 pilus assembly protein PilB [Gimesia sp.]MCR9231804.1 ATPase, T2SS/T4P/T4SS family [bacterium]KAA0140558.1 pilus assembly protein PilB [Gimesia chilikensis]QDT23841.1 Type II/IV secretion system protein [Gimesia chilikensis]QDT87645.1 Type II/IV secretion system protein [Gimesia chilikensis]